MGICKCKKRTDLFCFVHKKAVCETCICTEHQTCIVKTYVDWLTDSDYDDPTCGICKGELSGDGVLRLQCLDMFHPECLDFHASSLPPHTAKAGYICPVCTKPLFPTGDNENPIVFKLNQYLSKAPWASNLTLGVKQPSNEVAMNGTSSPSTPTFSHLISDKKKDLDQKDSQPQIHNPEDTQDKPSSVPSPSSIVSPIKRVIPNTQTPTTTVDIQTPQSVTTDSSDSFGIASRKPLPRDHLIQLMNDEEDEDKYRKRSVMQLFTALGLVKPSKQIKGRQSRVRFDVKRMLVIFALIFCLVTVLILGMNITSDIASKEDQGVPKSK